MKVIIGKFSHEPFHALSKKDLSLIFKIVPKEWVIQVTSVVLSSKIFSKTKLPHPIEYKESTQQLCIYSRGLVREEIARQLLRELALLGAPKEQANPDRAPDIAMLIKPFMDKFLKTKV